MEGKNKTEKWVGWKGLETYVFYALPSPPSNYLQAPQPNKTNL